MGENTVGETGYDFFISFAEDAKEWVYGVLVPKLGRTGKRFVLETPEINGQFKLKSLQTYIENSQTILLILSPQYLTSERKELIKQMALLRVAEQSQWQVIPILLKSVERELVLRLIDGIDLTKGYEHEERLDVLLASGVPTPEEAANLAIPPYPGMVTFKEEDASRFFGRDDEIDEYVRTLRNQQLLVLTGASGCGKSSLARAGIIPQLKAKHQFLVKSFRPSDANLASWLAELEHLLATNLELAQAFLWQGQTQAQHFLLLIDQFEELFALETSERPAFTLSESASHLLRVLKKLRQQIPEFYLLVTVRAEFFPQLALCQPYIDFDKYLQRVNALGRKGLTAAITQPALKKGVFIDERLVERLVNDAGDDPGILPFVQETLRDLWERRYERYIGLEAYEHLGGKAGSGLKASIAAKADAAYKSLTAIDKNHAIEKSNITKRIFLRLIQFGEGKPDTRRQQSIAALRSDQDTSGVFEETLRHLSSEKYRLLTVNREENDEDSKVDIVHEALIKAWPMLQEWIRNYKELEEKRRIFDFKLKEWMRLGCGEVGLLDLVEINEIEESFKKNGSDLFLIDYKYNDFIDTSKKAINPGFSIKGLALIGLGLFVALSLLFYLFIIINAIPNGVAKNSYFLILSLVGFFISLLFYLFFSKNKFAFQKISKYIDNKYGIIGLCCLVIFSSVLWYFWGIKEADRISSCEEKSYSVSDKRAKIAIVNFIENENLNPLIFPLKDYDEKVKVYENVKIEDIRECRSFFTHYIAISKNDISNKNIELYNLKLYSLSEDKIILEKDIYSNRICNDLMNTAHQIASIVGVDTSHIRALSVNSSSTSCDAIIKDSMAYYEIRYENYDQAIVYLKDAILADKKYVSPYIMLARAYIFKKDYDQVINLLSNPTLEIGNIFEVNFYLGEAFFLKKDFDKALHYYTVSLEMKNDAYDSMNRIAEINILNNNLEEARKILFKLIPSFIGDKLVYGAISKNRGILYYKEGDCNLAMKSFKEAADINDDFYEEINSFKQKCFYME